MNTHEIRWNGMARGCWLCLVMKTCKNAKIQNKTLPHFPAIFKLNPQVMNPLAHCYTSLGEGKQVPKCEKYRLRHIRAKSWKCFKKGKLKYFPRRKPRSSSAPAPVSITQCNYTNSRPKRCWLWGAVQSAIPALFFSVWVTLHCIVFSFVTHSLHSSCSFSLDHKCCLLPVALEGLCKICITSLIQNCSFLQWPWIQQGNILPCKELFLGHRAISGET